MATKLNKDSTRMYSWWWDSHISPKNSRWLKDNLTDMDAKVNQMIKLLENEEDTFARRAEMYYKKRPELMKLVEEFYRAYRALAERYNNATGVIRHAHKTMVAAFPDQLPSEMEDDFTATESDGPRTPEMPPPIRSLLSPDELQKDALGLSSSNFPSVKRNGAFFEEPASGTARKGFKQFNELLGSANGRARKGLNFESEGVRKAETEIKALKSAITELEAEKESSLLKYQQSLEKLSNLESEISGVKEDSRGLNERATKAETEVQQLKDALTKLELEREALLLQYQQCLRNITALEDSISHAENNAGEHDARATKAEIENQALKQDLVRLEVEKEAALVQYKQCLDMISNLEEKLFSAEEDARKINQQANKAEDEVETLKQTITKLMEEKEASALQHQQCLETIADLERKLAGAQVEARRLNRELEDRVAKLKGAEEQCLLLERSNQTLHSDMDSLMQKLGIQKEDLTGKQKELEKLWSSLQEERLRFSEAETAFQTLQHLHSQSQEELKSLAKEFQTKDEILKDMENHNHDLVAEVQRVKDENKGLDELNLSSALSITTLEEEILVLKETVRKLEAEVGLRVEQRNALQQEIYCLKEELNDLSQRHQAINEQVESVGLDLEGFGKSVKELQEENSELKEVSEKERTEKVALLAKLVLMEKLVEKNYLLENSISDLSIELAGTREKMKSLEEACQSLLQEKSILVSEKNTLMAQLHTASDKYEKLSEKKNILETSLFAANAELEGLRLNQKSLEDSCLLLGNEKSGLITEKESLFSQLDMSRKGLEDLEKGYSNLNEKYLLLEKERESTLWNMEELKNMLDAKKQEYASFLKSSEAQMTHMGTQILCLQEENQSRKRDYEEELDKAVNAEIEIFILQKCAQNLEDKNLSLSVEYENIVEASKLSEKLISGLKSENREKQVQIESLIDQVKVLRMAIYQVWKRVETDVCDEKIEQDQAITVYIVEKLEEMQNLLSKVLDENQQSVIENSVLVVLLQQLKLEVDDLSTEKSKFHQELKNQCEKFLCLQGETKKIVELNEKLISKATEGGYKMEGLKIEIENFRTQLLDLHGAHKSLQEENHKMVGEMGLLKEKVFHLEEEKYKLEEENVLMFSESISQNSLSIVFKDVISDTFLEIGKLNENLVKLHSFNDELERKVKRMEHELKGVETGNLQLQESLQLSESELSSVRATCDMLTHEVENGKDLLSLKEKELLEAENALILLQTEKTEAYKLMEALKCENNENQLIKEEQEKQILKLSRDCDHWNRETECASEANQKLEVELRTLHEKLSCELLEVRDDVDWWELQATTLFGDLQISIVREELLAGKISELTYAINSLEDKYTSKDKEIAQLKERCYSLEAAKKEQLAIYTQAIALLNESMTDLEKHSLLYPKLHKSGEEVTQNANSTRRLGSESNEDHSSSSLHRLSDLEDMQMRIKAIENAMTEIEALAAIENCNANSKLEVVMGQIEELKSGNSLHTGVKTTELVKPRQLEESKSQKQTHEISEDESTVMPKDIMLDQMSECPSYARRRGSALDANDQMLELWETGSHSGSIDLKVEKAKRPTEGNKRKNLSAESVAEKELGVDSLEISDRFTEKGQEGNKRKVLERLDSDLQKLTNLQITVEDLKNKMETPEKSKKGKGDEYDTINVQLEETQEEIGKLFNVNRKLVAKFENVLSTSDGKSVDLDDHSGNLRRKRISEQARRGSEKIGRLQLEVQRIQFILLNLNDEKQHRSKMRKTRVLLRDYIYGGTRATQKKKKKSSFCSCMQPPPSP